MIPYLSVIDELLQAEILSLYQKYSMPTEQTYAEFLKYVCLRYNIQLNVWCKFRMEAEWQEQHIAPPKLKMGDIVRIGSGDLVLKRRTNRPSYINRRGIVIHIYGDSTNHYIVKLHPMYISKGKKKELLYPAEEIAIDITQLILIDLPRHEPLRETLLLRLDI